MPSTQTHTIHHTTLGDGSRLVCITDPHAPFSIASAWIQAGARYDWGKKSGMAHVLEHMHGMRLPEWPTALELNKYLDGQGIDSNAETGLEHVVFYQAQTHEQLQSSLTLLVRRMKVSVLTEEDLQREKRIVLEEIHEHEAIPAYQLDRAWKQHMFPGHSLSSSTSGTHADVDSISLEDVERFRKQFYAPERTTYLVITRESLDQVKTWFDLEDSPKKPTRQTTIPSESIPNPTSTTDLPQEDQVLVSIGYQTCSLANRKNIIALDLLLEFLSGSFLAKPVQRLREERQMTYGISGETANFRDGGYLRLDYACATKHLKETIAIIDEEIERIQRTPMQETELDQFKRHFISRHVREQTDPYALMYWYGNNIEQEGDMTTFWSYIDTVRNLTPSDIQNVAKTYLKTKNRGIVFKGV